MVVAMYLTIVMVVGFLLRIISALPSLDQHQVYLKQHYEHLAYIAEFKCHSPQPRVLSVLKLLPQCDSSGKAYFPDVTVLDRCADSTGCCSPGLRCDPLITDTVRLPFKVTFLEDVEHHKRGSWAMEYYDFDNHTQCVCSGGIDPRI